MSKILLVDLPWRGKVYAGRAGMRWAHTSNKSPVISFRPFPFYIGCTAALLEQKGHEVIVVDALAEKLSDEDFFRRIEEFNPDFILAETHTPSYNNDKIYMKELKDNFPNIKLILAGPHATALPEQVLKETGSFVDFIISGEYEHLTLHVIDGKEKGPIVKLKESKEMNEIPWPARHLFKMNLYNEVFCRDFPNVQLMASRGCPFRCSYCNIYQMSGGRKHRTRNIDDVMAEIKQIVETYKPKEIYFDDDNIDATQNWLSALMNAKIESGKKDRNLKIPFTCMGHVNIKPELLDKMKEAGCVGIKLGIESTDNEV
ncbi:MAG: radical SAM protein, partial [Nanoarchaeota archaeon]|nr:radical SAM protein [Nanoarchaeota archaeon]